MDEIKKIWAELKAIPVNAMQIVNAAITTLSTQLKTSKGTVYLIILVVLGYDIVIDPAGGKIIKNVISHAETILQTIVGQVKDINWITLAVIAVIIGLFLNRKGTPTK